MANFRDNANFIWQVADDILRGSFKQHEYGDVILPFVVLRRLDCVLEGIKDKVIETYKQFKDKLDDPSQLLLKATDGLNFYNTSFYDLRRLAQDAGNVELNFNNYINGYSGNVREILENFQIEKIVAKLVKNDHLFMLIDKFTEVDLHPNVVSNHEMGYIFEELLRRFSEMSNETAGEHYTPREVIKLMVNLLFAEHGGDLQGKGIIRSVFDPACGTGGMLVTAKDHIQEEINPDVEIVMYGQELNEQTYAIAKSDVLIMGEEAGNIRKWIIENDWLESIVAMPTDMFYNTGIATYIWIVTNKKPTKRRGKVQLINATVFWKPMRKSLGSKRRYITDEHIKEITSIYTAFTEGEQCKIFDNEDFGYTKLTVERPLVENGAVKKDKDGTPKPDSSLRDYEKIPLKEDIDAYFAREVLPHVPDAWMDRSKDKIGYEINFTKYFYKYQPLRPLAEIKADILALEKETEGLLKEILD